MANNKYYGYSPKKEETTTGWNEGTKTSGTRLDKVNPYEFRKGMDYELTSMGVSRLKESTPEEREKATESVLKNLESHSGYYSAIIQFETGMDQGGQIKEKSFKKYLESYSSERGEGMKEMGQEFKSDKMEKLKESIDRYLHKQLENLNEGHCAEGMYMTAEGHCMEYAKVVEGHCAEGMYMTAEGHCMEMKGMHMDEDMDEQHIELDDMMREQHIELDDMLMEAKGDGLEEPEDEDVTDKKSKSGAKKIAKQTNRFEKEKTAIKALLYGSGEEASVENPEKGSFYFEKNEKLKTYIDNKDKEGSIEKYRESIQLSDKQLKALEDHVKKFGKEGMGNEVTLDMIKGDTIPATIQKLESRGTIKNNSIDKEELEFISQQGKEKNELAGMNMSRQDHLKLLEIIKEYGVNLNEGAAGIKMYYEIAKRSYLEGLSKGLGL
tara:strand:+ start:262 stop:1572 length:1311 start_codon:yes stop_codon:yes gene_type:complete